MIKYFNNKKINISVNVNNKLSRDFEDRLERLNEKVEEIDDSLMKNEKSDKLNNFISLHDDFMTLLSASADFKSFNSENIKFMEIVFDSYYDDVEHPVFALVNGQYQKLNDVTDEDYDSQTPFKITIPGYVIKVEVYCNAEQDSIFSENLIGTKMFYNKDENLTSIYFTNEDYRSIYELAPNNKVKIYYID